jgi:hypothetical protein
MSGNTRALPQTKAVVRRSVRIFGAEAPITHRNLQVFVKFRPANDSDIAQLAWMRWARGNIQSRLRTANTKAPEAQQVGGLFWPRCERFHTADTLNHPPVFGDNCLFLKIFSTN